MKLKPVEQQVVVLMGASSGIGRQTALDFAGRGAKIVAAARDRDGLESLADEIHRHGGEIAVVPADTSIYLDVKEVADTAIEVFGRIDTWVHLAAVSLYAKFEHTTPDEFQRLIEINLLGQAFGAMVALPHLKRNGGGALIHISAIDARRALPYQSAYAASKHGITGFLDALRVELKHEDAPISVTEILPSAINTPLFEKARTKLGGFKAVGLGTLYQPSVVSEAILYAAENPIREFVVGGSGKMLKFTQELSPCLTDTILLKVAFDGQKSSEPRHESAPDNLYASVKGLDRVQGTPNAQASAETVFNWIETHPWLSRALAVTAIGAAAAYKMKGRKA